MTFSEQVLIDKFGYEGEYADFPRREWRRQVAAKEVQEGYWGWVVDQRGRQKTYHFRVDVEVPIAIKATSLDHAQSQLKDILDAASLHYNLPSGETDLISIDIRRAELKAEEYV